MAYKIAIATSNGIDVDETFGATQSFTVFEVSDGEFELLEKRSADKGNGEEAVSSASEDCGVGSGCGSVGESGCTGSGGGKCGGSEGISKKVKLIDDCRAVVCKKIGFQVQKQLERKAISAFDVNCTVKEALEKITFYYKRIDNHESLRKQ